MPGLFNDIRSRRPLVKLSFNVSQYAISITAARVVYAVLSKQPVTSFTPVFRPGDLIPALLAALTYFAVNIWLVAIVSTLAECRASVQLPMALYPGRSNHGPYVARRWSEYALIALNFSLLTWPLCVLPVLAVSGALAAANASCWRCMIPLRDSRIAPYCSSEQQKRFATRGTNSSALLLIDLDHFKQVNDAMGHPVGDELLAEIGQRLGTVIREEDFAARLGGDEFAVLCSDLPDTETVLSLANRIVGTLSGPVVLRGVGLHVEASVGIALSPTHGSEVDLLLQRADVALYKAKRTGPGSVVLYENNYDDNSIEQLALMEQLRSGLEQELVLYYQPKCRLSDGAIVGVEALARWQHPTLGLLLPANFLVAAENTGLMMPLTLRLFVRR